MDKIDSSLSKGKIALNSGDSRDPEVQVKVTGVVSSIKTRCEEQRSTSQTLKVTRLPTSFTPSTIGDSTKLGNFSLNFSFKDAKNLSDVFTTDGRLIVQPKSSFFSSSTIWNNCCIGVINDNVKLNFNDIRTLAIEEFSYASLIDVFQHDLNLWCLNLILIEILLKRLPATATGTTFIDCVKPAFEVFFKPWNENLYARKSDTVKMWLHLIKVPYIYWSVKGLCMLASSLGRPLCLDSVTMINIKRLKPVDQSTVCVDMSVLHSRPNVILASLDGSITSLARFYVQYISEIDACSVCHGLFHDAIDCERLYLIWKTENLMDNMDTHGWRINGIMYEYSDSDADVVVVGPSIEKNKALKITHVIILYMTSDSSVKVAEVPRKKRRKPRKFSMASSKPVNAVKCDKGKSRKKKIPFEDFCYSEYRGFLGHQDDLLLSEGTTQFTADF